MHHHAPLADQSASPTAPPLDFSHDVGNGNGNGNGDGDGARRAPGGGSLAALALVRPDDGGASSDGDGASQGIQNRLLGLLAVRSSAEYGRLLPLLESVTFARGQVLFEPGDPISSVHFPEGCVTSLIKVLSDGKRIEVGTTGREGLVGLPAFLDADSAPLLCVVQVPGAAQRLSAAALREAAFPGGVLHSLLQRYAQYLFDQAAQSVACNALHRVEKRCARWLLMTHDRAQSDQFGLTHEFLAAMLAVRRASVSGAAEALQRAGLIQYRRGKVTVVDRLGLERASCECYASDRADFERLLPPETSVGPSAPAG
ncbi:MAG TPA: Crp/Fnr family transcriptional regulator [Gemmatimonadaceae bacterium]|nr:Crp/Fnr family transcriptional regulator [Gemmatimonadaceae bacterium]